MAIKSSPFGPVILSGDDADLFLKQINEAPPNPLAEAAMRRGAELARLFRRDGKIVLRG